MSARSNALSSRTFPTAPGSWPRPPTPTTPDPRAGGRHSGHIPLTLDELTAIATTGSLAVTAPALPAVPLMRSCGAFTDGNGPELTQEKVARLDRALEARWASMPGNSDLTLDRPIGSLRLTDFGKDNVCEVVTVESPAGAGRLDIAVVSGRSASSPQDEYLNEIDPDRAITRLPDGSTVTLRGLPIQRRQRLLLHHPSHHPIDHHQHHPHRGFHRAGDVGADRIPGHRARTRLGLNADEDHPSHAVEDAFFRDSGVLC